MRIEATNIEKFLNQLPSDRKEAIEKLRKTIKESLPQGFEEAMSCDMIAYVVPHRIYPPGYHVNPKEPVPFISSGVKL